MRETLQRHPMIWFWLSYSLFFLSTIWAAPLRSWYLYVKELIHFPGILLQLFAFALFLVFSYFSFTKNKDVFIKIASGFFILFYFLNVAGLIKAILAGP